MSSAILFLAIIAIWACVLIPRWLRRSHEHAEGAQDPSTQVEAGQPGDAGSPGMTEDAVGSGDFDSPREQDAAVYGDPVAWEAPGTAEGYAVWQDTGPGPGENAAGCEEAGTHAEPGHRVETSYSVTATYSEEVSYSTGTAGPDASAERYGGPEPGRRYPEVPAHPPRTPGPPGPPGTPGPPAHVLQARRRTLSLLIVITVAAMGAAFVGITPWWTTIVPFVMLGGYLMLLHEAAHADAERAQRWAEARARSVRAARAAELARQRRRRAEMAAAAKPVAQIINLSALAAQYDDKPYDQYADAEFRAVGD